MQRFKSVQKVKSAFRKFGEALLLESEKEILEFVRGYLDEKMKDLTPELFVKSIREKRPLIVNPKDRAKFQRTMKNLMLNPAVRKLWMRESHNVDAKMLLSWWRADRPDLYGVALNWPDRAEIITYVQTEMDRVKNDVIDPISTEK